VADLRPGTPCEDPELRRLMIGRAAKLERLGLAEQAAPVAGPSSRTSSEHSAISLSEGHYQDHASCHDRRRREPDVSGFALHDDRLTDQVLGRLVERGLHDELKDRLRHRRRA